jgi:hypothetical protein
MLASLEGNNVLIIFFAVQVFNVSWAIPYQMIQKTGKFPITLLPTHAHFVY